MKVKYFINTLCITLSSAWQHSTLFYQQNIRENWISIYIRSPDSIDRKYIDLQERLPHGNPRHSLDFSTTPSPYGTSERRLVIFIKIWIMSFPVYNFKVWVNRQQTIHFSFLIVMENQQFVRIVKSDTQRLIPVTRLCLSLHLKSRKQQERINESLSLETLSKNFNIMNKHHFSMDEL